MLRDGAGSAVAVAGVEVATELGAARLGGLRVGPAVYDTLAGVGGGGEGGDGHEEDVGELHYEVVCLGER